MKFTNRIEIRLPLTKVVELWNNPDHFQKWQTGYVKTVALNSNRDEEGAQSEIYLQINGKEMKLLQTVLKSNLPFEKKVLIEHSHMTNTLTSTFRELGESLTEYCSQTEYTKFNGFMPKLAAILFPGMFKKQSQAWLDQFKEFAENTSAEAKPQPLVLGPEDGRSYTMGPMHAVFKADLEETNSTLSVSEWWLEPTTEGPHIHKHPESHVFYIIEGTLAIFLQGKNWFEAKKGSYVYIPSETEHSFENRSDSKVGFISFNTPGGFEKSIPSIVNYYKENPIGQTK